MTSDLEYKAKALVDCEVEESPDRIVVSTSVASSAAGQDWQAALGEDQSDPEVGP